MRTQLFDVRLRVVHLLSVRAIIYQQAGVDNLYRNVTIICSVASKAPALSLLSSSSVLPRTWASSSSTWVLGQSLAAFADTDENGSSAGIAMAGIVAGGACNGDSLGIVLAVARASVMFVESFAWVNLDFDDGYSRDLLGLRRLVDEGPLD